MLTDIINIILLCYYFKTYPLRSFKCISHLHGPGMMLMLSYRGYINFSCRWWFQGFQKEKTEPGPGIYLYKRNLRTFTASFKEHLILIDENQRKNTNRQTDGRPSRIEIQKGRSRFRSRSLKHVIVCTYFWNTKLEPISNRLAPRYALRLS